MKKVVKINEKILEQINGGTACNSEAMRAAALNKRPCRMSILERTALVIAKSFTPDEEDFMWDIIAQ